MKNPSCWRWCSVVVVVVVAKDLESEAAVDGVVVDGFL